MGQELAGLIAALHGDDDKTRWKAALKLGQIGKPAVPALIEALCAPDYRVRIAAANAVRDMKGKAADAVPALAANLSFSGDRELGYPPREPSLYAGSPSMQVRWSAVAALAAVGREALTAVPALIAMLRGDREHGIAGPKPENAFAYKHWRAFELRGAGAWMLQKLAPAAARQDPEVIPALAAALQDPACMVRINAARALRRMGPAASEAVPALLQALEHKDRFTRIAAGLAFTALGREAAQYIPQLVECHNRIELDSLSRKHLRQAMFEISGQRPKVRTEPAPPPPERHWAALDRKDFLFVGQPFADSSLTIDPPRLVEAFIKNRICNALTYWADHTWYNTPPPTADQLALWGMGMVWYFFTEDIFNPMLQRDWGFATLDEYNLWMGEQILETGRTLGKDRAIWAVGHEQFDNIRGWSFQSDGSIKRPKFKTKKDGYEFYRRWLTMNHNQHWMEYGSTRPGKFFDGWNTGANATYDFIAQHRLDTSPVTLTAGGVCPMLGHAAFDILPQVGMYWWECQIEGTSQQVGAAYLRGAARQYGKKWLFDASPWSTVHGGPGRGYVDGKWSGGVTDETQLRSWIYGYLAGADAVLQESSGGTHFRIDPYPDGPSDKPIVTSTGKAARKAARFCFDLCPDRGKAYTPVAILMEHEHGFEPRPHTNFRLDGAWGYMPIAEAEYAIEQFWYAAFPGHSSYPDRKTADPDDPCAIEPLILTQSAFGDCFDVLTDRCPDEVMRRYPRLMTLGGIKIDAGLWKRLKAYVKAGGALIVNAANLDEAVSTDPAFGCHFGRWTTPADFGDGIAFALRKLDPKSARVALADAADRPVIVEKKVGRGTLTLIAARHGMSGTKIDNESRWLAPIGAYLQKWIEPVWPVQATTEAGGAPQVMLNELERGWLVTIGNHGGKPWAGRISLRAATAASLAVEAVWAQKKVRARRTAGAVCWPGKVPPYSLRTYRIVPAK
jgi:HEAT repeat protein